MSEIQPALLTRSEIEWLLGKKRVSKSYERKFRHSIKKKIETLTELELPLLMNRGFNVTTYSSSITTGSNAAELNTPSLVGRGIANQEVKSNKVVLDEKEKWRGEWDFRSLSFSYERRGKRKFEPTCPFGHGISNPTPYQARRPPQFDKVFSLMD
jgi:hypothetical protein